MRECAGIGFKLGCDNLDYQDLFPFPLFCGTIPFSDHKPAPAPRERLTVTDLRHLEILKQGVQVWNQWRADSPEIKPDLMWANLSRVDLREANLRGAYLNGANLRGANLSRVDLLSADLGGADLSEAILTEANLRETYFNGAYLNGANLREANLSGAYLSGADLREADLGGADLTEAKVSRTDFGGVDLSNVKGLERIQHLGPSMVGIDTVHRSYGKIPVRFLRGAGMPDTFIEYTHSLAGSAFHYHSCFISYSSKDQGFADRIYSDLQDNGVRCWFAPEDLKIGDKFRQRIDDAIRLHDKLLVVLSEASVNSGWVEEEVQAALAREKKESKLVLFPVRLDDAVLNTDKAWAATLQRMRHIGDFSNWKDHNSYQKSFQRLLRDLQGNREKAQSAADIE